MWALDSDSVSGVVVNENEDQLPINTHHVVNNILVSVLLFYMVHYLTVGSEFLVAGLLGFKSSLHSSRVFYSLSTTGQWSATAAVAIFSACFLVLLFLALWLSRYRYQSMSMNARIWYFWARFYVVISLIGLLAGDIAYGKGLMYILAYNHIKAYYAWPAEIVLILVVAGLASRLYFWLGTIANSGRWFSRYKRRQFVALHLMLPLLACTLFALPLLTSQSYRQMGILASAWVASFVMLALSGNQGINPKVIRLSPHHAIRRSLAFMLIVMLVVGLIGRSSGLDSAIFFSSY